MQNRIFTLNSVLDFGKFKGQGLTIKDVMWNEPHYIEWCIRKISWFALDDEAMNYLWNEVTETFENIDILTGRRLGPNPYCTIYWRDFEGRNEVYDLNKSKLTHFLEQKKTYQGYYRSDSDDYFYEAENDYRNDSWDAMTDGMYGDMPDGFDGDYDIFG